MTVFYDKLHKRSTVKEVIQLSGTQIYHYYHCRYHERYHLFLIRDASVMHFYIIYLAYIYPEKEKEREIYINIYIHILTKIT